jgi:hypothetical protein
MVLSGSGAHGKVSVFSEEHHAAATRLNAAVTPTRSMLFYTLTATLPVLAVTSVILFTKIRGMTLITIALMGSITSLIAMGRMMYDLTYDIAGSPEYKLPIWAVFYMIIYVVTGFAFLYFAMHLSDPLKHFGGFSMTGARQSFLDALYSSLWYYIGAPPAPPITVDTGMARMLTVSQGVLSMFINVVIITKFVGTF